MDSEGSACGDCARARPRRQVAGAAPRSERRRRTRTPCRDAPAPPAAAVRPPAAPGGSFAWNRKAMGLLRLSATGKSVP